MVATAGLVADAGMATGAGLAMDAGLAGVAEGRTSGPLLPQPASDSVPDTRSKTIKRRHMMTFPEGLRSV